MAATARLSLPLLLPLLLPRGVVTAGAAFRPRVCHEHRRERRVRGLFQRLDGWIVRRVRSHQLKRWRNAGRRTLPESRLYGELVLVHPLRLIPSMQNYYRQKGHLR